MKTFLALESQGNCVLPVSRRNREFQMSSSHGSLKKKNFKAVHELLFFKRQYRDIKVAQFECRVVVKSYKSGHSKKRTKYMGDIIVPSELTYD